MSAAYDSGVISAPSFERHVSETDLRKKLFKSLSSSSGKCSSQTDSQSSVLTFLVLELILGLEKTGGVSLNVILKKGR